MAQKIKFVAFDLGASSGRAVLGLLDGGRLELEEIHRFENEGVAVGDSLHWDVLRLFSEMKEGLRRAVQLYGAEISGAGVDTWGVDFGLLGPDDVLLENPHCYRDSRIDGMMAEALKMVPAEEIYERTGIQFMTLNTLYHMLYLARNRRWMLDTARTMLMMPDLFNFWFTGAKVNEFTEATTSQFYNPTLGDWDRELLDKLDIPSHFLGKIVQPGTVLGKPLQSVIDETGAAGVSFVAPGTHDTPSAVVAVPATGTDYAYLSSGTWSLMGIESKQPIINEQARALNVTNEGGVGGTYTILRNITGLWLVQECRRIWAQAGRDYSFAELADKAAAAEPFKCLVDPDNEMFMKPCDMPANIRTYCKQTGQPVPEDEGAVIRAALDSLALTYRKVLEGLESLTGRTLNTIHIIGGGTQNKLLCQLAANATGRQVIAGPVEATAIGSILTQAIALGHVGSIDEAREIVRNSFEVITYDPRPDTRVEDAYGRFRALVG